MLCCFIIVFTFVVGMAVSLFTTNWGDNILNLPKGDDNKSIDDTDPVQMIMDSLYEFPSEINHKYLMFDYPNWD